MDITGLLCLALVVDLLTSIVETCAPVPLLVQPEPSILFCIPAACTVRCLLVHPIFVVMYRVR